MRKMARATIWVVLLAIAWAVSGGAARGQDRTQGRSMVISRRGVVAAESPLAAQAGASVLAHGGNAADAATAGSRRLAMTLRASKAMVREVFPTLVMTPVASM